VARPLHALGDPGQRPAEPQALPGLPAVVAVGNPADLLRRRPDIVASERALAAATARIGVATAELFPHVTFTGSVGYGAGTIGGLGDPGSGTRLKLLEAMAYKAPIVATSIGAEGIDYTNRENILIADEAAVFANSVVELLNDRLLAKHIAAAAFSFVENKYDWNIIGDNMSAYLHALKN